MTQVLQRFSDFYINLHVTLVSKNNDSFDGHGNFTLRWVSEYGVATLKSYLDFEKEIFATLTLVHNQSLEMNNKVFLLKGEKNLNANTLSHEMRVCENQIKTKIMKETKI